ncbi:hypothetical protein AMBR_FBHANALA_01395 [Dolosigranulum pigrum]|jgi:hypothetical protein|nr:hypothetical protein AMBR_FBHANALA_01395 [Dolosigranulum pigrum]
MKKWDIFVIAVGLVIISLSYTTIYPILNIITGFTFIGLGWYRLRK